VIFVPHRKQDGPPRSVTGIDLLSYMLVMFVPHWKHAYGPPRSVTEMAIILYVNIVRTSQETTYGSTVSYGDRFV
jgi:hypothetical protein